MSQHTTSRHAKPRRRGRLAVAALAAVIVAATPGLAAAAPVQPAIAPATGWSTNGPVYATAIIGNTVYAGGSFTQVRNYANTQTLDRANLAAFDRTTGAIQTGFTADTNGVVRALTTDGTRLYVGGSFTTIRGVARQRVAAIDAVSGAPATGFVANAGSHVYALTTRGNRLFVGGAFSSLSGAVRNRIGAVSLTNGAIDPTFNPNADASVRAIAVSPDATTAYVGGQFTTIGGGTRSFLAPIDATTGAIRPLQFANAPAEQMFALDISPTGDRLFGGGQNNRAVGWSTVTGTRLWQQQAGGDIQAIKYHQGNVFFGFHEQFDNDFTVRLLAADATTGVLENWRPTINSFFGIWAIAASDTTLAVGGEFTNVSGVAVRGVAMLNPTTTDLVVPGPPSELNVTDTTGSSVTLAWAAGSDNVGVGAYRVLRNGVEVAYTRNLTLTDPGLASGTPYAYAVQTVDTSGNRSTSLTVDISTDVSLLDAGSTWRYSDQGLDLGTAWRTTAYNDTGWAQGAGELGYGDGNEVTALGFGPDPANKYTTYYFRRHITIADPTQLGQVTAHLLRDDGAAIYVNGAEVARSNLPAGPLTYLSRAPVAVGAPEESTYLPFAINPTAFVTGDNVIAVEVHQVVPSSSDMSFDLSLDATVGTAAPDLDPPSIPTGLAPTTVLFNRVDLSWNAATDNLAVTGYEIRREGVLIGTTSTTTFSDSTVAGGQSYTYTASARDAAGNRSAESAPSVVITPAVPNDVTAFGNGSVWNYTQDGIDRGTTWKDATYNDTTWPSGPGQLGYGDGDETTTMFNGGAVVANRFVSHYLRRAFTVTGAASVTGATLSVLRDDGIVVYINGTEVFRNNMPTGTITASTYATVGLSGVNESTYMDFVIPPNLLVEGNNVIAVSVHNNSRSGSGDLSFDARLIVRY